MAIVLFILTLVTTITSFVMGCLVLKLALAMHGSGVWRGFGPGKRLITTYTLYGGTQYVAYFCFAGAALSKSSAVCAIGWGVHALSYVIASTLPYCKKGKAHPSLRMTRRVAFTLIIAVSVAASFLFAKQ